MDVIAAVVNVLLLLAADAFCHVLSWIEGRWIINQTSCFWGFYSIFCQMIAALLPCWQTRSCNLLTTEPGRLVKEEKLWCEDESCIIESMKRISLRSSPPQCKQAHCKILSSPTVLCQVEVIIVQLKWLQSFNGRSHLWLRSSPLITGGVEDALAPLSALVIDSWFPENPLC